MIFYGTKIFNKLLGAFGEVHECENCHKKYKSRLLRRKTWMHIMFIPFCPFGTKYKEVCPICFKQKELTKKQAKELMKLPDNGGQDIKTYVIHHMGDKNGYEIWTHDINKNEKNCVLSKLNKTQIKNFKKNMGLKELLIEEVE